MKLTLVLVITTRKELTLIGQITKSLIQEHNAPPTFPSICALKKLTSFLSPKQQAFLGSLRRWHLIGV